MTAATVAITDSQLYEVLGAFIVAQLGISAGQVIQGYPNRTAMPSPASAGFVAMSTVGKKRLRTNVDTYSGTTSPAPAGGPVTAEQGQQLNVQIDCYGPSSFEWADVLSTLLRDNVGCLALAPYCQPLYADDPTRAPLMNAEAQYEDRWIVQAALQYNQVVTTSQEYAVVLGPVDIMTPIE